MHRKSRVLAYQVTAFGMDWPFWLKPETIDGRWDKTGDENLGEWVLVDSIELALAEGERDSDSD